MEEIEWETNAQRGYLLRPQTKVAELSFKNKLLMLTLSMCQNHGAGGSEWQEQLVTTQIAGFFL